MTDQTATAPPPAPAPPSPPAFYAPGERERQHPTGAEIHTALSYSSLNGYRDLQMDVFVPSGRSGPVPCVVWVHGGAWLFGSRQFPPAAWPTGSLFQAIIDAGLAVATIDYRHSREASFPAQLHDGKAAIRYLRRFSAELGIDPDRLGVWGESAGGHLASLLALVSDPTLEGTDGVVGPSSAVAAAVSFYGVADVATMPPLLDSFPADWAEELKRAGGDLPPEPIEVLLASSPFSRDEAGRLVSPVHHVAAGAPPFLLIHGDADGLVPLAQSEQFFSALTAVGADVELVRVPGADHVFLGTDPLPQFARAIAFLRDRLTA